MAAKTEDVTTKKPEEINRTNDAGAGASDLAEAAKPATPAPAPAPAPAQGRRAPGTKEPIQFLWKLVGHSAGVALTLFKAVEREEVEAQLTRIHREGYYTDLKVLDINAKVIQPTPLPAARTAGKSGKAKTPAKAAKNTQPSRSTAASKTPAASKTAKAAKATKVKGTAPETKKHKRTADAGAASKPRPRAKASSDKSAAKTAKKKSAKAASTKKRSAKSTTKKK